MSVSRVDQLYRKLLLTKFFTKGWGKPDNLKRLFAFRKILGNREKCQHLVSSDYPIFIDKEYKDGGFRVLEGHFTSPFVDHLPGIMPPEVEKASFQMILPVKWRDPQLKPVCIHLAGTGDHFFWRRRLLTARPLLKESGIASILLENPYYGTRKPKEQLRSSLHNVSDLFVMGAALVLESMALLHWCEREGWGPLGLSGISMGGHMASLAATNWTKPIPLIPCLSWSTASCVFTEGVMSGAIPWKTLQEQFFKNSIYQDEIKHLIVSPEILRKSAYSMGQQFVKDYSANVEDLPPQPKQNGACKYEPSISAFEHHALKMRRELASIATTVSDSHNTQDDIHTSSPSVAVAEVESSHTTQAVASKGLGMPVTLTTFPSQDSSCAKPNPDLKETSQNKQSVSTPVPDHTSASSNATQSDTSKKSKRRRQALDSPMPISLSYAKTKGLQQQSRKEPSDRQGPFTLQHALAKSNLMSQGDGKLHGLREEAFDFMRGVMDECTHLGNFSVPVDPELIIIVAANQDAYIPREGVLALDQLWPGSEVRYIDQGHVGAVVLHQKIFRKAIVDAFDRQIKKYYNNPDDHQLTAS